jgi:hypothetical protein
VIPVARKLWMPSLVALLQERACQRPALAAAEVRNMPLSPPARRSPGALPLGMTYYFAILLFLAAEAVHGPPDRSASLFCAQGSVQELAAAARQHRHRA